VEPSRFPGGSSLSEGRVFHGPGTQHLSPSPVRSHYSLPDPPVDQPDWRGCSFAREGDVEPSRFPGGSSLSEGRVFGGRGHSIFRPPRWSGTQHWRVALPGTLALLAYRPSRGSGRSHCSGCSFAREGAASVTLPLRESRATARRGSSTGRGTQHLSPSPGRSHYSLTDPPVDQPDWRGCSFAREGDVEPSRFPGGSSLSEGRVFGGRGHSIFRPPRCARITRFPTLPWTSRIAVVALSHGRVPWNPPGFREGRA
jgi:hypothetical protein